MAAPQNLGQYLAGKIRQAIGQAIEDEKGTLEQIAKEAGGNVNVNLGGATGSIVGLLALLGFATADPALVIVSDAMNQAEQGAGGLGIGFGIGYLLSSLLLPAAEPVTRLLVHASEAEFTSQIYDPATVAALAAAGIWTVPGTSANREAAGSGFDPEHLAGLIEAEYAYPSWTVGLELMRRGAITPVDFNQLMVRGKIPPTWQPFLAELQRVLLSPADLALANLRGFMNDATAAAYAQRLGITQQDFQTLIDNTGEPPGLEVMLDMYRRNIVDKPTLEHGIRESRVRNEWIPALEAYRFHPMSIADAIRVRVENYFDDATALAITTENGLDPTHYPYLVEAFGRPLSLTEMSALFHRGLATEAQVKQAVRESDIKDKYVDKAFELRRVLLPERQIDLALEFGAIGHEEAIRRLLLLGLEKQDAEIVLTLGEQQHHRIQKDLTASNVVDAFVDRLMTREEASQALTRIGYRANVADTLLDLAKFKHHAGLAKIAQAETRALFVKHDIDREQAIRRLKEGGNTEDDATALVDEWELAKGVPTRHLSAAQIIKAAEYQIIDLQNARGKLRGLGYSDDDAKILLQLAGLIQIPGQAPQPGAGPTPQLPHRPRPPAPTP